MTLRCAHTFEKEAIEQHLLTRRTCPMCRTNIDTNQEVPCAINTRTTSNNNERMEDTLRMAFYNVNFSSHDSTPRGFLWVIDRFVENRLTQQKMFWFFNGLVNLPRGNIDSDFQTHNINVIKNNLQQVIRKLMMDDQLLPIHNDKWQELKNMIIQASKVYYNDVLCGFGGYENNHRNITNSTRRSILD